MDDFQKKVEGVRAMAVKNRELYDRLTGAAAPQMLAAICREQGLELSPTEAAAGFELLQDYLAESQSRILSDEELERVAAGSQDKWETTPIEDCSKLTE